MRNPGDPPDPYGDTGQFNPLQRPAPPSRPPARKRRRVREELPTWLIVLAVAFIAGAAVTSTLVFSPSARHAASRAAHLVHHPRPVTKTPGLLAPAVVVRPASAPPVVVLSPPPPVVTPTPVPSSPTAVRTTPEPVRTTAKPSPTPTASTTRVRPSVSPTSPPVTTVSPTLVTTPASPPTTPPLTTPPPVSPAPTTPSS